MVLYNVGIDRVAVLIPMTQNHCLLKRAVVASHRSVFCALRAQQTVSEFSLWESIPACPRGYHIAWRQASLTTAYTGSLLPQISPMRFSLREGASPPPTIKRVPPTWRRRPASPLPGNESRWGRTLTQPSHHWVLGAVGATIPIA